MFEEQQGKLVWQEQREPGKNEEGGEVREVIAGSRNGVQ